MLLHGLLITNSSMPPIDMSKKKKSMHYIQNARSTDIAFPTGDLGGIIYYLPTSVSENKRNHQGEYPNEQIQNTVNSIAVYFSQELDLRSITKKFGTFSLIHDGKLSCRQVSTAPSWCGILICSPLLRNSDMP